MHGIIPNSELLVGESEGHAEDVFNEHHDQRSPDHVPANDEHGTCDLVADLHSIALDGATGVQEPECGAARDRGKNARGAAAEEAGDEMGVENAEDVVDGAHECDFLAENVHAEPGHGARPESNADGGPAGDDPGGGGDGYEATDHSVDGADDGGFAVVGVVAERPGEHAHRGADICV